MEEFLISNSEKGFLSARDSRARHIKEGWDKIFKNCSRDESILLENILSHKSILENGTSVDIGTYDGFALSIVRRVFGNLISKELVSVQPLSFPTGKVFYLDALATTGTSNDYKSIYESHYDSSNYDASKGQYTLIRGSQVSISETNYNSGTSFNIPYSGEIDSLGSLKVFFSSSTSYADMVALSGANGVTTQFADAASVSISSFDNNTNFSSTALFGTAGSQGWMKFEFTTTPTTPVSRYGIFFVNNLVATSWKFCGSTNNTTWVLLDQRSSLTPNGTSWNYYIPNDISTPYKYYMVTGITNPSGLFQITEFELSSGGTTLLEEAQYAISPTNWTENVFASNQINIMAHQTGSSFNGTVSAFSEWRDYSSTEGISGMQQMKLNVVSSDVEARTRKIKGKVTEELLQDAEAYFNINASDELSELISEEIAAEIDREIIGSLINIAPYKSEWYYDMYALTSMTGFVTGNSSSEIASAVTQYRWAQDSLLTAINKMDATIKKANIYHGANWLICSTRVGNIIETMKEYKATSGSKILRVDRLRKTGKLKSTINVYIDPYLPENICLLGYNGKNWDSGYIYAPYIMAAQSSVRDPDTLFELSSYFLTRYATKIITNKKYGLIDCKFSSNDLDRIVNEV